MTKYDGNCVICDTPLTRNKLVMHMKKFHSISLSSCEEKGCQSKHKIEPMTYTIITGEAKAENRIIVLCKKHRMEFIGDSDAAT
jgi:hypothetical protein